MSMVEIMVITWVRVSVVLGSYGRHGFYCASLVVDITVGDVWCALSILV